MEGCDFFVSKLLEIWDKGHSVFPLDQRLPQAKKEQLVKAFGVSEVISEKETYKAKGILMEPDDALVIATSGTTGDPKGVVLTHTALKASSRVTSSQLDVQNSVDEWLCCILNSLYSLNDKLAEDNISSKKALTVFGIP